MTTENRPDSAASPASIYLQERRTEKRAARARRVPTNIALIAVFTAFIILCSTTPAIPLGSFGVPLTLQTFGVVLTGLILGGGRGFLAASLYVVLGLLGLPIFAGFRGGPSVLVAPSVGYLLSFPFLAAGVGFIAYALVRAERVRARAQSAPRGPSKRFALLLMIATVLVALLINHGMGILGLMLSLRLSFFQALGLDLAFVPGDLLKDILAVLIALIVYRAYANFLIPRKVRST